MSDKKFWLSILAISVVLIAGSLAVSPIAIADDDDDDDNDDIDQFIAVLNSGQENPPTGSIAFGVAHLTYNEDTMELCFSISYNTVSGMETAAHFHGPAPPGVNAGVLIGLDTGTPKNGCVTLTDDQEEFLEEGLLYINVHSSIHPGGEIRGQVLPIGT